MNNDYVFSILRSQMKKAYPFPNSYYKMSREAFELQSCRAWAAQELVSFIRRHKYMSLIDAVDLFRMKVDTYECYGTVEEQRRTKIVFSCATEVAMDVLDYLISLKIEEENGNYIRYNL